VRRVYRDWGRGDFRAGTELFDSQIVLVLRPPLPETGTYHGPEAIGGYMRGFLEAWDEAAIAGEDFTVAGDRVLVSVHQQATGIGSGAPVDMRYFQVWTFRDGRVIRIESIHDRSEALEAAGLEE